MGVPNIGGNLKGYQDADLSRQVDGFKDKMFYLVHGTADDNVHLQQSMVLARALSQAGIIYRQQVNGLIWPIDIMQNTIMKYVCTCECVCENKILCLRENLMSKIYKK